MVSLRQRTSQPSYTSMAGLEDLSDGEGRPAENGAEGVPAEPDDTKMDVDPGAQSDDSMSSGRSSAFNPDPEGDGKKKKRKGVKGKGKAVARDRSESAFEGSQVDSDEDMSEGEESDSIIPEEEADDLQDEEDSIAVTPRGGKATRGKGGPSAKKKGLSKRAPVAIADITPSYALVGTNQGDTKPTFDTTSLPPAYKQIIKASAEYLSKPPKPLNEQERQRRYEKYKKYGLEGFAEGPSTPFRTTLTAHPRTGKDVGVQVHFEDGNSDKRRWYRQKTMYTVEERFPIYTPWKHWEGEGWWKGMYDPANVGVDKKGKGKQNSKDGLAMLESQGWRMREDVKLGLEGVGRFTPDELVILSKEQATPYLPTAANITCHLGPHASQHRETFVLYQSHRLERPDQDGSVLFTGGPIWGLDWCPGPSAATTQYLAISTLRDLEDRPLLGTKRSRDNMASIQIWSIDTARQEAAGSSSNTGGPKCEMVICVQGGAAMDIKWMPLGARDTNETGDTLPKMGILAAAQLDGSISLYSIPQPSALRQALDVQEGSEPIYLRMDTPLLRLTVEDAMCSCIDWMTGSKIVSGLSNGHGIIWDVQDALKQGVSGDEVLPVTYMTVGNTPIGGVAAARQPSNDVHGNPVYDSDPTYVAFATYEGTTIVMDTREPEAPIEANRERKPAVAIAWGTQLAAPIYADGDNAVHTQKAFGGGKHKGYSVAAHRGAIWSIAASDYHCIAASSSADGGVLLCNYVTAWYRKRKQPVMHHRMYEMDYDAHTNEYRMTDDFLPEAAGLVVISDRFNQKKQTEKAPHDPMYLSTAAWLPEVGVHKVSWNSSNGLRNAGWLASGMACGLARVEWVDRAK